MTVYEPLPLHELASLLRDETGDFHRQWRLVMEFLELFRHEPGEVCQRLIDVEPAGVDARWDAFLGGLAEFVAERDGLIVPAWALQPERCLAHRWFIVETSLPDRDTLPIRQLVLVSCPDPFRSRGVFLEPQDLEVA